MHIEFFPNAEFARLNPTISFIQTEGSNFFSSRVDTLPGETDPYYGAQWDEDNQQWGDEPGSGQHRDPDIDNTDAPYEGSRPYTAATGSAVINDSAFLNINEVKYFETAVVVIETGELLGTLTWNIQHRKAGFFPEFVDRFFGWESTSTIVRNVACNPSASPEFYSLLENYYREHPESVRPQDGSAPRE
ncbi:MAG: hypothetical protein GY916_06880 [Gammaproteobacteria bacterium]|nr:hypothetical protein [Gammaproteobacteria bacterium]